MITTQRLWIIVVLLNMLIPFTMTTYLYYNNNIGEHSTITNTIDIQQELNNDINDETVKWNIQSTNQQEETSLGDSLSMGEIFWTVFAEGVNPFDDNEGLTNMGVSRLEQRAITIIILLLNILNAYALIELYLVLKNRKAT